MTQSPNWAKPSAMHASLGDTTQTHPLQVVQQRVGARSDAHNVADGVHADAQKRPDKRLRLGRSKPSSALGRIALEISTVVCIEGETRRLRGKWKTNRTRTGNEAQQPSSGERGQTQGSQRIYAHLTMQATVAIASSRWISCGRGRSREALKFMAIA